MTWDEEENAVRQLGELIGYERLIQHANQLLSRLKSHAVSDIDDDLLRDLPVEIWTESDIGQSLLQLAREGRCRYTRLNSTFGRFERIENAPPTDTGSVT